MSSKTVTNHNAKDTLGCPFFAFGWGTVASKLAPQARSVAELSLYRRNGGSKPPPYNLVLVITVLALLHLPSCHPRASHARFFATLKNDTFGVGVAPRRISMENVLISRGGSLEDDRRTRGVGFAFAARSRRGDQWSPAGVQCTPLRCGAVFAMLVGGRRSEAA